MVGSWGDIPPPPGRLTELKVEVLTDLSDIEEKIGQTLSHLPEELRHQFVDSVRSLLLNGGLRLIRADELLGKLIASVDRPAPGTLKTIAFYGVLEGLDERCLSALRTANCDGA